MNLCALGLLGLGNVIEMHTSGGADQNDGVTLYRWTGRGRYKSNGTTFSSRCQQAYGDFSNGGAGKSECEYGERTLQKSD